MLTKLFIRVGFSISLFVISTVSASIVSAENEYVRITCNLDEVTSIVKIEEVNFHLVTRNAPMDFIANGTITAKPGWRLVQPANGRFDGLGIGETNQYTVISTDGREQSHSGDIVLYKVDVVVDQLTEEIETSPSALIAGPQSGRDICTVTVRCYPDDETNAVIQVSNDGVGILYDTSTSQSITLACFSPQELKTKLFILEGVLPSREEGDSSVFAQHTRNNCSDNALYTVAVIQSRTLAKYEPSPENRGRRELGVGEIIKLWVLPDNLSVQWSVGNNQSRAIETIKYQCPSSASNVVIFATPISTFHLYS